MRAYDRCRQSVWSVSVVLALTPGVLAAPPLVVETEPLSPAAQQQQFHLPAGFQIELIASEPDIGQPMNLNFDAAGRLWVTHSVEYPYPVAGPDVEPRDDRFGPNGQPPAKDRLSIISGIGTDNVRVSHVAEGLNIPIGIVPLSTSSAIAYSIPNIDRWTFSPDVSGADSPHVDDSATRQALFGPFGNVDTHGMVNGLTHWIDGWVYACHGFRNTSSIRGTDGHAVSMNSGNTFRFAPDGSHVEQYTFGQVNPFGLTFDSWGNIYTADCHSRPLTCLIPGAYYSSFGKPHDGLGFGPDMIDHSHGSTGICGPCYYAAEAFPPDYRDNLFLCNPVTGIVHRDKLIWHGSTPQVDTQPDFITCTDGWFRPVDIQLGPDGALYIADFYNAVIGHYEVPLDNPHRDRTHGRIWRVTHAEGDEAHVASAPADLTKESLDQLIDRLDDPNLTTRVLASHQLVERFGREASSPLREICRFARSERQRVHALWLLPRLGADVRSTMRALADVDAPFVQTHLARVLGNLPNWDEDDVVDAAALLTGNDPRVRRAAAEAIALHPQESLAETLLRNMPAADLPDTHLRHAMRIALRNCLRAEGALRSRVQAGASSDEVASICLSIGSAESAAYLLNYLRLHPRQHDAGWIEHIARHGSSAETGRLARVLRERPERSLADQVADLKAFQQGQELSPSERHPDFLSWAADVAHKLLDRVTAQSAGWQSLPLPGDGRPPVGWGLETRTATDGRPTPVWSSLPGGEQGVGIARSPSFALPEEFSFRLAGHDGYPQNEARQANFVRLVRDADGAVLNAQSVPRQDAPIEVTWHADDQSGAPVHVELVDGLDHDAYAWIAAGRFSVAALNPQQFVPSELAADLIVSLQLVGFQERLRQLIADPQVAPAARADLAGAVVSLSGDVRLEALQPWLRAAPDSAIGHRVAEQFATDEDASIHQLLVDGMRAASSDRQQAMADILAGHADGAQLLIELIQQGHASPRLLQSASLMQKLLALGDTALLTKADEITRDLPPRSDGVAELISERRTSFRRAETSSARGREVFKKTCAACHQIGNEGKKVGPQLDGVGIRGLDRLLEDTLDPNRNVDAAFRSTTILTTDGRVLSGLLRREEGDTLVLADSKGEEFRVPVGDIEERALSPLSLMPADIAEKLPAAELHDLLAFLLSQRQAE